MDWQTIWANIGANYTSEFRQWAETNININGMTSADFPAFENNLNTEYATWTPPAQATSTSKPGGGATEGVWNSDPSGATDSRGVDWWKPGGLAGPNKKQYWHPAVATPSAATAAQAPAVASGDEGQITTEPVTGWKTYIRNGVTYVNKPAAGSTAANPYYEGWTVKPTSFTPGPMPSGNSTDPYILVNGSWQQNPDYVSPDTQAQTTADRTMATQNMLFDQYNARQELEQRQRETTATLGEQAQRNVFQPQTTPVNAEPTTPVNWINYWKAGQEVAKRQTQGTGGLAQWASFNATPEQTAAAKASYGTPAGALQGGYRTGLDPTTGQQIAWNRPEQMTQMWDPFTQSYRPETNQEYQMRISQQGVNAGVFTPEIAQQQDWSNFYNQSNYTPEQPSTANLFQGTYNPVGAANTAAAKQAWMDAQAALWRQPAPTGPETPQWAQGVLTNPQANINLGTLGQPGNMVRPVSAQMYQNWAPSQQQSYQGLAAAQNYPGGIPYQWPDYKANIEKMWGASRPGDLARQKVPSWSY